MKGDQIIIDFNVLNAGCQSILAGGVAGDSCSCSCSCAGHCTCQCTDCSCECSCDCDNSASVDQAASIDPFAASYCGNLASERDSDLATLGMAVSECVAT